MISTDHQAILGSLLGTAVGDALGLPSEGLSRAQIARRWSGIRHRLIFGKGMFSDDTEHTLMVASALLRHRDDPTAFQRALGWKLRWWLLALPAGVGLSTAKAIVRLWIGFPATRSGVRSAGNGAAMRSAILGVMFREDAAKRREFVLAACRLTHTDPRAEESAILVAEAAVLAASKAPESEALAILRSQVVTDEMQTRFAKLEAALAVGISVPGYASDIGCSHGVSGFASNTVAVALFAWLRHRGQFEAAVRSVIECGGDTDTVAAITGGICGAEVGEAGIPSEWIDGICDWPRSVNFVRRLAKALATGATRPPQFMWPAILPRNLCFLITVLLHGFRRLLSPY